MNEAGMSLTKHQISDEMAELKTRMDDLAKKIASLNPEPTILSEKWELQEQGEYGVVVREGGQDDAIAFYKWRKEIAALPDALRALKMVYDDGTAKGDRLVLVDLNAEQWGDICNALKKAGIV